MSGGRRARLAAAGLGAVAIAGAAGALALLFASGGPAERGLAHGESRKAPAVRPVAVPRSDVPAVTATRVESASGTLPGGEDAARALAEALLPHVGREAGIREALRAARAGEIDPVELGLRLHDAIEGRPEAAAALVPELCAERDGAVALQIARALGGALDDAPLRAATVAALGAAEPAAREVGLLALLGRGEPEVLALAARSFTDDPAEARATAGFLLNQAPPDGPAPGAAVLEAARAALLDPRSAERVREESLGLLGRPGAPEADLRVLERALLTGPETCVRGRALRAFVEGGTDPERVRTSLERALALGDLPEEIRGAIRAWLARPPS